MYAWIIDTDHLADTSEHEGTNGNAKGITGPRTAPDWMCEALKTGKSESDLRSNGEMSFPVWIYPFEMSDDDGELYYSGRLMVTVSSDGTEEACYAPLGNFGMPNAGCVSITYPGHPGMDCG